MADERKPIHDMRMFRTLNGGWVIRVGNTDYGRDDGTYSYSSDRDLLTALPDLIGAQRPETVEEFIQRVRKPGDMVMTDDPR